MRTYLRTLFVLAAATCGLSTAHAQLQTFDTRPNYGGSVINFSPGDTMGQSFTNVSSVKSMTYNFFEGTNETSSAANFTAVFGQWNGTAFIGGTTVTFTGVAVTAPGAAGWSSTLPNNAPGTYPNFEYVFDLTSISSPLIDSTYGYLTNPANTYALMITNTDVSATNVGLGISTNNAFAYGAAVDFGNRDWTFSQIVITPGNVQLTPVPESSTVAALAGATFLTGLIIKRRRQKSAAGPLAAA